MTSLIKPASMTLNKRTNEKTKQKYAELMHQAHQATGRKEAVGLIHKAAKLKTKSENYEMMLSVID